jgi:DDE superfamily endonuclease
VRHHAKGHVSAYHRVCAQRRWSAWELARRLRAFLLTSGVPTGPVVLAGDATVAARPGPHGFGKGRHRDGVRSTHRYTAYRGGQKGVVLSGLGTLPVAIRPWALPVWLALSRGPEWAQAHGTRHKTPAPRARLLVARVIRWFPDRQFSVVGDSGYGPSETARFCRPYGRHRTVVSTGYGEAALDEPPPPRLPGPMGRPRVQGQPLTSPHAVVANTAERPRLTVAW